MKTSQRIAALLMFVAIPASAVDLVYGEDFENSGNTTSVLPTFSAGEVNSKSQDLHNGTFSSGTLTLPQITGTSDDSFTIGFHMYYTGTAQNMSLMTLTFDGVDNAGGSFTNRQYSVFLHETYLKFGAVKSGEDPFWISNKVAPTPNTDTDAGGKDIAKDIWGDGWYYVALTFEGNSLTTQIVTLRSDYTTPTFSNETITLKIPDSTQASSYYQLTNISSGTASPAAGRLYMDNIALYDGSLSEADVAYLSNHSAPKTIPEPATATLSLLALAGLAARRRRK